MHPDRLGTRRQHMGLGTLYIVYSKSNKSLDVVGGVLRVLDSPHTEVLDWSCAS